MFKMSGEQGAKVTLMDELRLDDFALEICYSLIPPTPTSPLSTPMKVSDWFPICSPSHPGVPPCQKDTHCYDKEHSSLQMSSQEPFGCLHRSPSGYPLFPTPK